MRRIKGVSVVVFVVAVFSFLAIPAVEAVAASLRFSSTLSGSGATVTLDIDNDACGTAFICTELSSFNSFAGTTTGDIEPGAFTGQSVAETDPVPGTGSLCDPAHIKSCTLGSVTNACLFQFVGGVGASRNSSTGDILTAKVVSGTECVDVSHGLPYNFAGSASDVITGGSGKFTGASGTATERFSGQILTIDFNGHGFAWFKDSISGTITPK